MITAVVNKNDNKLFKNRVQQTDLKKKIHSTKRKDNVGLKIPGSNWERYKSLVTEAVPIKKSTSRNRSKKKRFNKESVKTFSDNSLLSSNIVQVLYYLVYGLSCCIQFIILLTGFEQQTSISKVKENEKKMEPDRGLTRVIAMDCEMVGNREKQSMLARVSIVNQNGICIYDKYVKPIEEVRDYRTPVSGIRPHHLENGEDFKIVQKEVADILKGRILVGHALHNDLAVLFLTHPRRNLRDSSRFKPFRKINNGNTPSLKKLASELLGVNIQAGEHNSIEDARTTMQLYQLFKKKWELEIKHRR